MKARPLTPLQSRVLDSVACHRGIDRDELARDCRTTPAAVSRALRVLVRRRMVYARELYQTTTRHAFRQLVQLPADVRAYVAEQVYAPRVASVASAFTEGEG